MLGGGFGRGGARTFCRFYNLFLDFLQHYFAQISTSTTGKEFLHLQCHIPKIYDNKKSTKIVFVAYFCYHLMTCHAWRNGGSVDPLKMAKASIRNGVKADTPPLTQSFRQGQHQISPKHGLGLC